jgi:hypothetical protein
VDAMAIHTVMSVMLIVKEFYPIPTANALAMKASTAQAQ